MQQDYTITTSIRVETGHPYSVLVGEGMLKNNAVEALLRAQEIRGYTRIVIVSDDHVAPLYLSSVKQSFSPSVTVNDYIFTNGESTKSPEQLVALVNFFAEKKLTRTDLVLALGGGVIGDITGFAASVYLRGIRYVQIPTTLLAQIDSSVGGKTAVNLVAGKNLMGSFYQPSAVLCDIETLTTLPRRVFCDGVAELIKYGCILDEALFDLVAHIDEDRQLLTQAIVRSIEIKADVVREDEREQGLRMKLNFGHTIGHAIEKHYRYAQYTHGQAVGIGMVQMTLLSEAFGYTQKGTAARIIKLLQQFALPYRCDVPAETLLLFCAMDKKNHSDVLHLVFLKEVGRSAVEKLSLDEFSRFLAQPTPLARGSIVLSPRKLKGHVMVPPSKSLLNRVLICAALANGESTIEGLYLSDDILTTMECLERLGCMFKLQENTAKVTRAVSCFHATTLDCNESGTLLRFMIPLMAALGIPTSFCGKGRLVTRPLSPFAELLPKHGVTVSYSGGLPFAIEGQLTSGAYTIEGDISSQFISGLLMSLPLLKGDSIVTVLPPFESKSYVDMTCAVLKQFGIAITVSENTYHIRGDQQYGACHYKVESDYSQAAFFLVANALGSEITLGAFQANSLQGDRAIVKVLRQVGMEIVYQNSVWHCKMQSKCAFHISAADVPDLVPILCLLATQCEGESVIEHTERLRLKESDRIESTKQLLENLGMQMYYENGSIRIPGGQTPQGGDHAVFSHNDHRIAMCAAIAATICTQPISLYGGDSVRKSYPSFFEDYTMLGGKTDVLDLE